ncbi:MAG: DUF47 family protein [Crenarchaeota archaeon]|nr:DUF47 family protein [Thermoproteota archaeon]
MSPLPPDLRKMIAEYFSKVYDMVEGFMKALNALNVMDIQNAYKHLETSIKKDTEADELRREILEELSKDHIEPQVKDDIARLLRMIDRMSEWIKEALRYLDIVPYLEVPQELRDNIERMSKLNLEAVRTIQEAVNRLVEGRYSEVYELCTRVEKLEEEGDEVMHSGRKNLLKYGPKIGNPALVIMLRDFLKSLENSMDYSEDIADMLRVIAVREQSKSSRS